MTMHWLLFGHMASRWTISATMAPRAGSWWWISAHVTPTIHSTEIGNCGDQPFTVVTCRSYENIQIISTVVSLTPATQPIPSSLVTKTADSRLLAHLRVISSQRAGGPFRGPSPSPSCQSPNPPKTHPEACKSLYNWFPHL